jgi:hypothetical protein
MLAMMRKRTLTFCFCLTIQLAAFAYSTGTSAQQQQQKQFQPTVGQEGKDVIWVPTPEEVVAAMLDMAKVTPNDYVIDLGSGDGRIVIAAAGKHGDAGGAQRFHEQLHPILQLGHGPVAYEIAREDHQAGLLSGYRGC